MAEAVAMFRVSEVEGEPAAVVAARDEGMLPAHATPVIA